MQHISKIKITDYNYSLPKEKIAQFPLEKRDESKLVIYKDNTVLEDKFKNITTHLPNSALLIYNETKVIHARLIFNKETGAQIEIFCLEPVSPSREIQQAFEQKSGVVWKCFVGNSKKWKSGTLHKKFVYNNEKGILVVRRIEQYETYSLIEFTWKPEKLSFSEILMASGIIPLPPYMNREAIESDKDRYQTVFANSEGSVAAPTAGLHFTDKILNQIQMSGILVEEVTLHVGAGTFKPVSASNVIDHEMHTEKIFVKKSTVQNIIKNLNKDIIVTGTTTMRTVESLYWFGVKQIVDKNNDCKIDIKQWDPYSKAYNTGIPVSDSLNSVLELMENKKLDIISGQTQLMILPGYEYKIPNILITNFHMPQSTLLLLVSAFIGNDWKKVYDYALKNDFRFLSYGDSCLFFRS